MDLFEHAAAKRPEGPAVQTVSAFTRMLAGRLADLGRVSVEGEVAEVKRADSGHMYFAVKDANAKLSCIAWKSAVQRLKLQIKPGDQLVVHGKIDVYQPQGRYSLIVDRVERQGLGALLAQLEKLKEELQAKGWFDRKRPLPRLPCMIGVVTSRDTAGWQDFQKTHAQRWPLFPLRLAHARVQGRGSAQLVARAIERLAASGVDLICVIRGGGSLEDLWTFNELAVAEAVFRCPVPVISGVGHQSDTTLIDLVADHRAHTPTDAAQVAVPERAAFLEALERGDEHLSRAFERVLEERVKALAHLASRPVLRDAHNLLVGPRDRLQSLESKLIHGTGRSIQAGGTVLAVLANRLIGCDPALKLEQGRSRIETLGPRLSGALAQSLENRQQRVELVTRGLKALSPLAVLDRGYSITRDSKGQALRKASDAKVGAEIETILVAGRVRSLVESAQDSPEGEGVE